jgi:bile acid-coenzyme A ligase
VADTAVEQPLSIAPGTTLLNPGPLYHNAPFIVTHLALFGGGRITGMVKFDVEETLHLIARDRVQWVNFVPTMIYAHCERLLSGLSKMRFAKNSP